MAVWRSVCAAAFAVGMLAAGTTIALADDYAPPTNIPLLPDSEMKNIGPHGEASSEAADVLKLMTPEDREKIRAGNFKAAIIWYTSAPFFKAVDSGLQEVLGDLKIEIVAESVYEFDAQRYKSQVETVLAKKPDVIFTISADPVAAAAALKPALDAGVKVAVLSNPPAGWQAGKEYIGVVTGNPFNQGKWAADMLANAVGKKGDVGLIYHDASFYVTNLRDRVLKTTLVNEYPDVHILQEKGFSDPAQAQELTTAMLTQNPSITAIYAAWDTVAEGVVAGIRDAGRPDVKVVTMDLGLNNVLNMVQNQQVVGITCEITYQLGTTLATEAGLALIGKSVPPFANTGAIACTRDNIEECWQTVFHEPLPDRIKTQLSK
ncbi:MAG: substrate-binding domain-containing protein [Parvibaculaceae bacterium]